MLQASRGLWQAHKALVGEPYVDSERRGRSGRLCNVSPLPRRRSDLLFNEEFSGLGFLCVQRV